MPKLFDGGIDRGTIRLTEGWTIGQTAGWMDGRTLTQEILKFRQVTHRHLPTVPHPY